MSTINTNKLHQLPLEELQELRRVVDQAVQAKGSNTITFLNSGIVDGCPHCGSSAFVKNGTGRNDLQRYFCKECRKTFSPSTGSAIHWVHFKDKWQDLVSLMFDGPYSSLRKSAEILDVDDKTIFRWRHKILTALSAATEKFSGITELDDIHFVFSEKGRRGLEAPQKRGGGNRPGDNDRSVKVLTAVDREKDLKMELIRVGRLRANDMERFNLLNLFDKDKNILTSDEHPSIRAFAKRNDIVHETFNSKKHARNGIFHVNTLNELARRLKDLVNKWCKGVATKYLDNYAQWFSAMEMAKRTTTDFFVNVIADKNAFARYHSREENYKQFLMAYSNLQYGNPVKWE